MKIDAPHPLTKDRSYLRPVDVADAGAQQDVFHLHFHIVPRSLGDNQDIKWITHKEWRDKFNELLNKLKD